MIKVSPKTKKASMYKGVYCKSLILVLQHNYTDLLEKRIAMRFFD